MTEEDSTCGLKSRHQRGGIMSLTGDSPAVDSQLEALGTLCRKLQESAKLAHSQTMVLVKHADTMFLRVEMARRSTSHVDVEDALCRYSRCLLCYAGSRTSCSLQTSYLSTLNIGGAE